MAMIKLANRRYCTALYYVDGAGVLWRSLDNGVSYFARPSSESYVAASVTGWIDDGPALTLEVEGT